MITDPSSLWIVIAVFFLAGLVKGVIGMGLPSVSLGFLTVVFNLPTAMALLVVPSIVTNLIQASTGGHAMQLLKRLWRFFLAASMSVGLGALLFHRAPTSLWTALLGVLLTLYGLVSLLNYRPSISTDREKRLAIPAGLLNGLLTGLTGSFVVPGVMFLQMLRLPREAFIQAMGILFTLSTLALALSLSGNNLMTTDLTITSMAGVIPAVLGMSFGTVLRKRLSETRFRQVFFYSMLFLGLAILLRSQNTI